MQTNNAYRLSIYLDAKADKDIIQWCNAQTNISAAFRDLFRNQQKYTSIMHELHEIKAAIAAIPSITPLDTPTTPKPTRKRTKPQVAPDILAALDNI
jgi:hypothetical protein